MNSSVSKKPAVEIKTRAELTRMKRAGEIAAQALKEVVRAVQPGVTTKELNRVAENFIRREGATPTFIGYRGYPAALCVSINDEVVHGIPGQRKIQPGDVVSLDVAATMEGFVGDTAATIAVPPVSPKVERLINTTKQALDAAIQMMVSGNRLGDVSATIQEFVEKAGYGVVRDFVGHGIGRQMHEEPAVPNYGSRGTGLRFEPGLALAIEPMVTIGDYRVRVLQDGWTVVTEDGSFAAHFEHTVAVTENGPWILTEI